MANTIRHRPHNLYHFVKAHPELKLELISEKELSVTFPENCSTTTLIMHDGNIVFLQYATFDSPELFTYDALKDFHYYQNLKKLIAELSN